MQTRTAALAVLVVGLGAAGLFRLRQVPPSDTALPCPPEQVRWVRSGDAPPYATCDGVGSPLPTGVALTVGQKLRLNQATEADLAALPGVGAGLARALIRARDGSGGVFASWSQVDDVPGVGAAKLEMLMAKTALDAR